jgi:hypothetical protein
LWVNIRHPENLIDPESDGRPMGENTARVRWIVAPVNGRQGLFRHRPDVFVAADLFWYPVFGDPTTVTAPDVMKAAELRAKKRFYRRFGVREYYLYERTPPGPARRGSGQPASGVASSSPM